MYQYKLVVNGSEGKVLDDYPEESWGAVAEYLERRSGHATLFRRLVTDLDILISMTDTTGYTILRDKVICPWEIFAEIEDR